MATYKELHAPLANGTITLPSYHIFTTVALQGKGSCTITPILKRNSDTTTYKDTSQTLDETEAITFGHMIIEEFEISNVRHNGTLYFKMWDS